MNWFKIFLAAALVVGSTAEAVNAQLFGRWRARRANSVCVQNADGTWTCGGGVTRSRTVTVTRAPAVTTHSGYVTQPTQVYSGSVGSHGGYAAPVRVYRSYGSSGYSGGYVAPVVAPAQAVRVAPSNAGASATTTGSDAQCCPQHEADIQQLKEELQTLRESLQMLQTGKAPPASFSKMQAKVTTGAAPPVRFVKTELVAWTRGSSPAMLVAQR